MAICLTRNFRSCSSFVFVGRRNHHANSCDLKTSNSVVPFVKEMNLWDCSPSTLTRSFNRNNNSNKQNNNNSSCIVINCNKNNSHNRSHIYSGNNLKVMPNLRVSNESVFCAQECKAYKEVQKESDENLKRADKAQLQTITNVLVEDLPELFNRTMNYKIYHPNMIFENNIRGTKTIGVVNYMREMFILKVIGNIRFSQVKFTILKITDHPEDGTVRVRWRIVGISQFKNILRIIKHLSQTKNPEPEGWYDGFSIFYVRSDGLIHKHIVEKMIPDAGEKVARIRNPLAAKIAFAVGISMKDFTFTAVSFEKTEETPLKVTHSVETNDNSRKLSCSEFVWDRLKQQNQ